MSKILSRISASQKSAFTLIELLVVITIIAILSSLLMVVINQVRYQARTTVCAVQLRQWGASLLAYAADNRGWLPAQSVREGTGQNSWDVSAEMYVSLVDDYGLPPRIYGCPLQVTQSNLSTFVTNMMTYRATNGLVGIGYMYWVQRSDRYATYPPLAVAAPSRTTGSNNMNVPLMSDWAGRWPGPGELYSPHMRSGNYPTNQVYIDGRVGVVRRSDLLFRYTGNLENWH